MQEMLNAFEINSFTDLMGAVIGSFVGARCFARISSRTLKYIVYAMMIVSGVVAIL